jgi:alpha-1,2-mannosyltransferase
VCAAPYPLLGLALLAGAALALRRRSGSPADRRPGGALPGGSQLSASSSSASMIR